MIREVLDSNAKHINLQLFGMDSQSRGAIGQDGGLAPTILPHSRKYGTGIAPGTEKW